MIYVKGLVFLVVGVIIVLCIPTAHRRQGIGTAIATATWGCSALLSSTFAFAEGFHFNLASPETRSTITAGFSALCVLSLFLIRKPKNPNQY